ncbi:2Fe-2S iron-sulfur cluster-binding protein [Arenicella xantha]|uniref:2Fe-2S ferredoxin n=1 Tax=Arenicella xantha TaxID=644221 RepID=A0A395JHM9_9GAMM|nr:2Fe-2S iron-sulfur cluster-binding protein [Arenicella xantha]RBP49089.1 2Fe-2S ferredoxin [Arenicella xantha]
MSKILVTDLHGETRQVEIKSGWSLMEVLRDEGYDDILAMCGGSCSCATCHVHVQNGGEFDLPPIEEDEEMLIIDSDAYHPERSRLSCQIELDDELDGLEVTLVSLD